MPVVDLGVFVGLLVRVLGCSEENFVSWVLRTLVVFFWAQVVFMSIHRAESLCAPPSPERLSDSEYRH